MRPALLALAAGACLAASACGSTPPTANRSYTPGPSGSDATSSTTSSSPAAPAPPADGFDYRLEPKDAGPQRTYRHKISVLEYRVGPTDPSTGKRIDAFRVSECVETPANGSNDSAATWTIKDHATNQEITTLPMAPDLAALQRLGIGQQHSFAADSNQPFSGNDPVGFCQKGWFAYPLTATHSDGVDLIANQQSNGVTWHIPGV